MVLWYYGIKGVFSKWIFTQSDKHKPARFSGHPCDRYGQVVVYGRRPEDHEKEQGEENQGAADHHHDPPLQVLDDPRCVLQGLPERVDENLAEWIEHAEDHPDVDHLCVRSCWQCAGKADKAARLQS